MSSNATVPARKAVSVTPSDSTTYSPPLRALYVGTSGNVAVMAEDDTSSVTFVGVSGILPVSVTQVLSTGTTASDIVGLK